MDFDNYVDGYSARVQQAVPGISVKHETFLNEKANQLIALAEKKLGNLKDLTVLDVGCGIGLMERAINGRFKSITGVDVSTEAIQEAARVWSVCRVH